MKLFIKQIIVSIFLTLVIITSVILSILLIDGDAFNSSYQSLVVDKYRLLQKTPSPKIILIGGSSLAFGLNQERLSEATGYEVVNLGLHAGFGYLFCTELAKENINPGDIVLLAYEYEWIDGFNELNQSLIMSGIGNNIDMYKHIPVEHWKDFIGYIFKYAQDKYEYPGASGVCSREAFDCRNAQMTMLRESTLDDYEENKEHYGCIILEDAVISDRTIDYLREFKKYVEDRGASIYFVAPPLLDRAVECDYCWFEKLITDEETLIGIPYISNPEDYFFEGELMFDTKYHCNSKGEKKRTELLISDLNAILN